MSKPLKGFITYSHEDTEAKDELITRLTVMKQQNELVTWHDNEMLPSDKWREEIFPHTFPIRICCSTSFLLQALPLKTAIGSWQ